MSDWKYSVRYSYTLNPKPDTQTLNAKLQAAEPLNGLGRVQVYLVEQR